ncbi:MAG: DNA primase [Candidatus Saganbacteria bacterium]|uniref:DNA primase n=1 Tax=Candidatus Saganbacteria bacterium TaxID=2575572 RepID=A0A833L1T8_UNCSA|nr:MAG: DNA primase [Candidatus Saganbacteria bacterium]
MIPKEKIEEIREKSDIVALVSEYLQLKKRGKNFLALCPFHSEKTPSFTVSQDKQIFHCFGCGEGGNVFAFLMKMEKLDFVEAVELAGEKSGIHIEKSKGSGEFKDYKDKIFNLLELACKFYETELEKDSGAPAREYIEKRQIKSAKKFRLGFAEDSFSSLINHLLSKGAKEKEIEAAGLIIPRQEKSGYYDRFRNRLMFPIFDIRGRIIGFSGRALGNNEPKYMNSPDTVVFNKGECLFAMNFAKEDIKKSKYAILAEGNIDVVSCHEAGFKNTVAPLGTALTTSQANILARFCETVVLAFDSDPAGLSAMERAYEILSETKITTRVLDLAGFKDPDEFIKAKGASAFLDQLKKSAPALEYKIKRILSRFNLFEPEAKSRAAHETATLLSKEKDKIIQREYIKLASILLRVDENILLAEVNKNYNNFSSRAQRKVTSKPPDKIFEAEKNLLRLAIESEEIFNKVKESISPDELTNQDVKEIFIKLIECYGQDIFSVLEKESQKKLIREALLDDSVPESINEIANDYINAIKGHHIKNQIEEIRKELTKEEKLGNFDAVKKLHSEYSNLSEILRAKTR